MSLPTVKEMRDFLENYCLDSTATYIITGTTTTSSPVIIGIASTELLRPQMIVNGAGIQPDSRILTVDSTTQITLDKNAIASATVSITITYYTEISDYWLQQRRDKFVLPYCERVARQSFNSTKTISEYCSGNGTDTLLLNRRNVTAVNYIRYVQGMNTNYSISLSSLLLIPAEGVIKARVNFETSTFAPLFSKGINNLEINYTYGYASVPDDVSEAIIYLVCEQALGHIGSRTGGGNVVGQGYSRSYGERGKYQDIRNDLSRQAHSILRGYMTYVVNG